jgi:hypothetical protein
MSPSLFAGLEEEGSLGVSDFIGAALIKLPSFMRMAFRVYIHDCFRDSDTDIENENKQASIVRLRRKIPQDVSGDGLFSPIMVEESSET